jgi:hypothetical protein
VLDDGETLVDGETRMELAMLEETRTLVEDEKAGRGRSSVKAVSLYEGQEGGEGEHEAEEKHEEEKEMDMVVELVTGLWR